MADSGDELRLAATRERIERLLERRNTRPFTEEEQAEYDELLAAEDELLRRRRDTTVVDLLETPASTDQTD